ncbi:MAG TPA: hypothetical protein VEC06_15495 [Paucimonas sp.]|nr:hypothetical protein [Paucimonas sp.]
MKRLPLVASFILFIALCVSGAYWGMQLFKPQVRQVAAPPQAGPAAPPIEAAAGLFGGRPVGAVVATNFQLKGVIAAGPDGIAILSADGKPPQPVGVDKEAAPGVTVKEVHKQYVLLNEGGVIKRVDLPETAPPGEFGGNMAPPVAGAGNMPPMQVPPPMPAPVMNFNAGQQPMQPPNPQVEPNQPMQPPGQQPSEVPSGIPGGGHPGLRQ